MSDAHTGDADRDPDGDRNPDAEIDGDPDTDLAAVELDFGETGRIPAIAQDADTGDVLMLAYVTPEAVEQTRETGLAHYYSRSREELWQKGATSGHVQQVREVRADCDGDALLYLVEQEGGACHTGYESCFYRTLDGEVVGEKAFDPDDVYE
ncbi:phosphoribosyl-AMP cyclohydrolase [Halorussus salinus]|uniref:phosphoribosyl-AMP cyclohydrolase n=1 Tax=Halorussus salinus TaxID=1364935 RepID=UPI001092127A|nr:phosphoribosyl-AMP cyclohydrolase [Halorussus salinus]